MENLLTEIKVMKQLDHDYIVKLLDFEVSQYMLLQVLYLNEYIQIYM